MIFKALQTQAREVSVLKTSKAIGANLETSPLSPPCLALGLLTPLFSMSLNVQQGSWFDYDIHI